MNGKKHCVNINFTTDTYWRKESILSLLEQAITFHQKRIARSGETKEDEYFYTQGSLKAYESLKENLEKLPCEEVDNVIYTPQEHSCAICDHKEIFPALGIFGCDGMEVYSHDSCDTWHSKRNSKENNYDS